MYLYNAAETNKVLGKAAAVWDHKETRSRLETNRRSPRTMSGYQRLQAWNGLFVKLGSRPTLSPSTCTFQTASKKKKDIKHSNPMYLKNDDNFDSPPQLMSHPYVVHSHPVGSQHAAVDACQHIASSNES